MEAAGMDGFFFVYQGTSVYNRRLETVVFAQAGGLVNIHCT